MKVEIEINDELLKELELCLFYKNMDMKEYIIMAIGAAVVKDMKNIGKEEI